MNLVPCSWVLIYLQILLHSPHLILSFNPSTSNCFLSQVEETVENVLNSNGNHDILSLPSENRESVGIARNLNRRLQALRRNNDCPRCWMQRAHCICQKCPSLTTDIPGLNRIFLLMHHKEIGMKVDTAKLIMAAFPEKCRLVVSGIGTEYQKSMKEFMQVIESNTCLVLFPDEEAQALDEFVASPDTINFFDLVVIDGTWNQARKMHARYIPLATNGGPSRVKLSEEAVSALEQPQDNSGHQMRRHSISWRQVGTFEATRLFLKDLHASFPSSAPIPAFEQIHDYQIVANEAAKIELGPPRKSSSI